MPNQLSSALSDMYTNHLTSGYKSLITPPYSDLAVYMRCTPHPHCTPLHILGVYTSHITQGGVITNTQGKETGTICGLEIVHFQEEGETTNMRTVNACI